MIRGLAAATLLGLGTLALAALGVATVIPILVARHWRRKLHSTTARPR